MLAISASVQKLSSNMQFLLLAVTMVRSTLAGVPCPYKAELAKDWGGEPARRRFIAATVAPAGKYMARDPRGSCGKEQTMHAALWTPDSVQPLFLCITLLKKYYQPKSRADGALLSAEMHVGKSAN